jgi:hypothetical protein
MSPFMAAHADLKETVAQPAIVISRRVPLPVKLIYSAFVALVVPLYWVTYSPWNFLYLCDVALLVTVVAIWLESPLLVSTQALAIVLMQTLWVIDLLFRLAGVEIAGITSYMLDDNIPVFLRALSLFHGWLPIFLLWLLSRLGYDRRALAIQSAATMVILLISYFFAPAPPPPASNPNLAVNINYVYGSDKGPQTLMAPGLWLITVMMTHVIGFYIPSHLVLRRIFAR